MSKTTETEMVAEMKTGKTDKDNNAGQWRSLRSRRVNYKINEKSSRKKKFKLCREVPLPINMEKRNNVRIFCSTTAFENIRKIIIETIASNYVLEKTENRDVSVVIETIKTKEENTRRVFIYRTTSTLLTNGSQVEKFVREILPVLQSWTDQNQKETDIWDQHFEKMLRKVYPARQVEYNNSSQHKIDHKVKGINLDDELKK